MFVPDVVIIELSIAFNLCGCKITVSLKSFYFEGKYNQSMDYFLGLSLEVLQELKSFNYSINAITCISG